MLMIFYKGSKYLPLQGWWDPG